MSERRRWFIIYTRRDMRFASDTGERCESIECDSVEEVERAIKPGQWAVEVEEVRKFEGVAARLVERVEVGR